MLDKHSIPQLHSQGFFLCIDLNMYSIMTLKDHISMSFTDDKNCDMMSLKSGDLDFKQWLYWDWFYHF